MTGDDESIDGNFGMVFFTIQPKGIRGYIISIQVCFEKDVEFPGVISHHMELPGTL